MTRLLARALSVALGAFVVLAIAGAPAHAQPAEADRAAQIERAAKRVLDGTYQDDREPSAQAPDAKEPRKRPKRIERDPPSARQRIREEETRQGGGPIGSFASMLMWGVIIAGVVIVAIFIARDLFKYSDADGGEPARDGPVELEEVRAALDKPLDDADQLAAAGRYAEAIHTLLLRTFQELARTSAVKIAASMTSREILARIPLLGDSRDALADLVMMVELTWFGDDVPGQAEWERCRGQFHRFVAAYQQRAPGRAPLPAGSAA